MTLENKDVSKFYDEYSARQVRHAFNERHIMLVKRLLDEVTEQNVKILEIGCGIGVTTNLIHRQISRAEILAIDISEKSVEIAKSNLNVGNVEFRVQNLIETSEGMSSQYDFITLFDVLEHIPKELHGKLFKRIRSLLGDQSKLIINIPSPQNIEYSEKYAPEELQIIDQPLPADWILSQAYSEDLVLIDFKTHNIWHEGDYQSMIFETNKPYSKKPVSRKKTLKQRIKKLIVR